jgi:hypothetical protein
MILMVICWVLVIAGIVFFIRWRIQNTGKYEYKFLFGGQWLTYPQNQEFCSNDFGTLNSVPKIKYSNDFGTFNSVLKIK